MGTEKTCPTCQSTNLEAASFDGMAITLDRAGALKKALNPAGAVHCSVCMECGALSHFHVDPKKIASMIS